MSDQAEGLRRLAEKRKEDTRRKSHYLSGTRIVAITSGKGGVGKTNLTVNLAFVLKNLGKRVLVFDADLGLANVDVIMGIIPSFTLTHVVRGKKTLKDIVIAEQGIKLVAGSSGVQELLKLEEWRVQKFLGDLGQLEDGEDFILIDTGAGISQQVLGFVLAATDIIIVTTPEPSAITDAYTLIKVIASKNRKAVVRLVVNRVLHPREAKEVIGKLRLVTREFLTMELHDLGYILEDPCIPKAVKAQEPFLTAYPHTHASVCLYKIGERLLSLSDKIPARTDSLRHFFQRMFNLFR